MKINNSGGLFEGQGLAESTDPQEIMSLMILQAVAMMKQPEADRCMVEIDVESLAILAAACSRHTMLSLEGKDEGIPAMSHGAYIDAATLTSSALAACSSALRMVNSNSTDLGESGLPSVNFYASLTQKINSEHYDDNDGSSN